MARGGRGVGAMRSGGKPAALLRIRNVLMKNTTQEVAYIRENVKKIKLIFELRDL